MPEAFDAAYWEQRYRAHGAAGTRPPSPQLVAEVADLAPGAALDAGCGEGADAVWLAERGWRVTAVDIAPTALDRGRERALAAGVDDRIEWRAADLTEWTPPPERYDLVTAQYVHPTGPPEALVRRLAAAVAPGGTLLLVNHDPADAHSAAHAPAEAGVTAEQAAACLDPQRWEIVVAEARTRTTSHHGRELTLRDTVLRARRRPERGSRPGMMHA
ncbi:class I SAM-dependent methyltransferase [Micromonospora sp. NPDC126480]|uniref:class I SAM-dependent methyltransferase n=1 Tax=Micromonospora sp. NPDC126480 TaxID=3155312 RepID=UPI003320D857